MRIVVVSQSYYPRPGGVTEHVHHAAEELRRRGHDVTILTTNFANGAQPRIGREEQTVRVGRNVLVPINGAWVNMTIGHNLVSQVRDVLRSIDPDIVHTHCPLAPTLPLVALNAAPRGSRIVGTFHAAAAGSLGYRFFKWPLSRLAARMDTRIAVSEAARELAASYFPGDYTIIPNGVDCERFHPGHKPLPELRDGRFNVLFVGRLDRRKGVKYLFRAMNRVAVESPRRLRLVVVGDDGPRRNLLPRLSPKIDLVLTGVVDPLVLPRYFASGDVFCSPATERESFGIVLLEAMASGTPVIGTGIPGYLTVLNDRWNSLVVPPRDPRALSSAIIELVRDEPLRARLRSNGLEFARRYRWERVVDQLVEAYEGTASKGIIEAAAANPVLDGPVTIQKA